MLETDPNFPSGPWTGFFLDRRIPGRHRTELGLTFKAGVMTGEGRDWVGLFTVRGKYDVVTGHCHWTKRYAGQHDVFYRGFNEGKGIWGAWEVRCPLTAANATGGFHIWPEAMNDPTALRLHEEADVPAEVAEPVGV
jgi:hypothetical protein